MKVLVLGSRGQLGRCFFDNLMKSQDVIFLSRKELNIGSLNDTREKILNIKPKIIINCCAYTEVDKAEEEKDLANLVNHIAVKNLAKVCADLKGWLIHFSTDYIYDGLSSVPYRENFNPNPLNYYGRTKLEGDKAIIKSGCDYLIFRTSWVYSEYGKNFLKTILELLSNREQVDVINDQIGCPTYAQDLAQAVVSILPKIEKGECKSGVYNFCGDISLSWKELAEIITVESKNLNFNLIGRIKPIKSKDFKSKSLRPSFSVLECSKIKLSHNIAPSSVENGIKRVLNQLSEKRPSS